MRTPPVATLLLLTLLGCAQKDAATPDQAASADQAGAPAQGGMTEEQKTLYALGQDIGRSISIFALTAEELEHVKAGLTDAVTKQPSKVELETYRPQIQALAKTRGQAAVGEEKKLGDAFVAEGAASPGAEKLASGVVYVETAAGTGGSPAATDTVKVHYKGTLRDGAEFDSSYKRGEPITFPLDGVIPCWTEGVQKMKVGGKATLYCPSDRAYGDRGAPPAIPGGAALKFEVELLEILAAK